MGEPGADGSVKREGIDRGIRGEEIESGIDWVAVGDGGETVDHEAPQDSYQLLNQKYGELCAVYDEQVETGSATTEIRNTFNRALKLLKTRVNKLIAKKGGQDKILEVNDDEGGNLIALQNLIEFSIKNIPIDAQQQREQRGRQFLKEQVVEIINILRQFNYIIINLPPLITQIQQKHPSQAGIDQLDAIYRSLTEFRPQFEALVGYLIGDKNGLVSSIMTGSDQPDEELLAEATVSVNADVERRNYCLTTIKDKITNINQMLSNLDSQLLSKLESQPARQFQIMSNLLRLLENRLRNVSVR